jgi:pyridinium-3,5-bisthiocarboxylic acid mononucleotide nickel chelatase
VRALHFDCFSGISGDMTVAALIDAGVDADAIRRGIDSLGLPITLRVAKIRKGGFAATQIEFEAPEEHEHRHLPDVEAIVARGRLGDRQRELALRIFRKLAVAEAAVHGMPLEKVHFHEVGALDSIADIVAAAIGLDLLGAERVTSRSVPTGSGTVKCAHGLMPIPAPGTAELLKGVPLATTTIKGELTTPTGAAILTSVVQEWVEQPGMTVETIGHGAGQRELLEQPNLLRIFVGSTPQSSAGAGEQDDVWVLETNLDDVPAEVIGYCFEQLFAAGALDVFSTAIQMKKNRPGVMLSVLAPDSAVPVLEAILFRETETFGIRRYKTRRRKLRREAVTVQTQWGPILGKRGWCEGGPSVFTPEYEDCARVARLHGIALRAVFAAVKQAYAQLHGEAEAPDRTT